MNLSRFVQSWARQPDPGKHDARIEQMERSMQAHFDAGACNGASFFSRYLAEAAIAAGDHERAQRWHEYATNISDKYGEHYMRPENLRIGAALALARGKRAEAETLLGRAQGVARDMHAVSFARRAARDLAGLQAGGGTAAAPAAARAGNGQQPGLPD